MTTTNVIDALAEASWIAEAADTLVERVAENCFTAGGNFGPVDGLNWIMPRLLAAICHTKKLAEAGQLTDEVQS